MKRIYTALFSLAVTLLAAASASAQDVYPSKVVKIVIPFAAGGSTDLLARSLAERLGEMWKQPVIVENRAGASGMIGSDAVVKAKADGYTLLLGTVTTHAVAQTLFPKLPYNVQRDFAPISELVTIPQFLSVNPTMPINSVQELVAYAKSKPGYITYGGNTGAVTHMAMELLSSRANIKMLHVPYKGSAPALVDLVGGQLSAGFDVVMTTMPHMKAGKLRVLAVSSLQRTQLAPQIPTVAESGFPGFEANAWFGLFAPARTPNGILNKISEDSRRVLNEPKMREKLEAAGFEIIASTPTEFAARVNSDVQKWRKVIKDANIKAE